MLDTGTDKAEAGEEVGTLKTVNAAFASLKRLECFQAEDGEGRTILVRREQQPDELAAVRAALEEMLLETLPRTMPSGVLLAAMESRVRVKLREKKDKKEKNEKKEKK